MWDKSAPYTNRYDTGSGVQARRGRMRRSGPAGKTKRGSKSIPGDQRSTLAPLKSTPPSWLRVQFFTWGVESMKST